MASNGCGKAPQPPSSSRLILKDIIMLIQIAALALILSALLQSPSLFLASLAGIAGAFCMG
jgi:hypothetical protein